MMVSIMQPYFFPYIGYWQLIAETDKFIVYDDVNYIKKGWINRNRLLINGEPRFLTLPIKRSSQNSLICDLEIDGASHWQKKAEKTILMAYSKSKYFDEIFPVIKNIINHDELNLTQYLLHQIKSMCKLLEINTKITTSSVMRNNELAGIERIIDICKKERAAVYVNPEGGRELYGAEKFAAENIDLRFIATNPFPYAQRSNSFFPFLSIIDVLMCVGISGISEHLQSYKISR